MNFQTEYKNILFTILIEKAILPDVSVLLSDKFNRISNKTLIDIKKGTIWPYHLIIKSEQNDEERTHYWSNIFLTSNQDLLLDELGPYLDDEEIIESIVSNWELLGDETGPGWK